MAKISCDCSLHDDPSRIIHINDLSNSGSVMKKVIKVKRLIKNGGKIQPNFDKGWIYCLENSIHDSFNKLSTENANGILNIYHLSGRNKDTFEMIDKHITDVPIFTGKVVYHT